MRVDNIDKFLLASVKSDSFIAVKLSAGVGCYRAGVLHVRRNNGVDVRFIAYENKEHVIEKDLRRLSNAESRLCTSDSNKSSVSQRRGLERR